jgi:beta-galactosidase GanA
MSNQVDARDDGNVGSGFGGGFLELNAAFSGQITEYNEALTKATEAWKKDPTDPSLTLTMQAAQGDLGTVTRGLGSLISALVSLQSEITQKIK